MPPTDSSIVEFVINLLVANKERLQQEFRTKTDRPALHPNIFKDALVTETPVSTLLAASVAPNSCPPHPAPKTDALYSLARDRVDKGFQRRDYSYLHTV